MHSSLLLSSALVAACLLAVCGCGTDPVTETSSPIRINEVMSANDVYQDLVGDTDDWIELYNPTDQAFDLTGYFISDSANHRFKDAFQAGVTVPAGGVLLVWADAQPLQSSPRAPHLSFQLSSAGEGVWLSNPQGDLVDSLGFGLTPPNRVGTQWTSLQRFPDGNGSPRWCTEASPEALNGAQCTGEQL
ncbi:MAG TPA: lamin tail domain-containing protein [Polyangiales bacterium]|nr:lamin tail domain-containing protein [Polyangiales bacterium]